MNVSVLTQNACLRAYVGISSFDLMSCNDFSIMVFKKCNTLKDNSCYCTEDKMFG